MSDSAAIHVRAPFPLLFGYAAVGFALLASFLWLNEIRPLWLAIDEHMFRSLNGSLAESTDWQAFWAIANSRLFDLVPAALMLTLFASYILADHGRHWRERVGLGVGLAAFTLLWMHTVIKPWLDDGRASPTLALADTVRLETAVAWVPWVKDHSASSFPGDHAGVSLLVALVIGHVCGWKRGLIVLAALPFVMLPRVVGGGHWLTDQLVGGGFVGLVGAAVFLAATRGALQWRARRTV